MKDKKTKEEYTQEDMEQLLKNLQKHIDTANYEAPYSYTLRPEDVVIILRSNESQKRKTSDTEKITSSLSNELKNSKDATQAWMDTASRESALSTNYVDVIDSLNIELTKKNKDIDVFNKLTIQQEHRLVGSSKRSATLAKQLKSARAELKELRSEIHDAEMDKRYGSEEEWRNTIAEQKYEKGLVIEKEEAADLYLKRITDLFDGRDAGLMRNCQTYVSSGPSGLPGHRLMILVEKLSRYANLVSTDIIDALSRGKFENL